MGTDNRIIKIAEHYGYESQSNQLVEEMGELLQAMNKFWRAMKCETPGARVNPVNMTSRHALHNMAEEIADVGICLEQVAVLTGTE